MNEIEKWRLPFGIGADGEDDAEGDPFVEVGVLDGQADHQSADEHHHRLSEVVDAHLAGVHHAQERETHHRNQTGDGQRKRFRHPVHGHY